MAVNCFRHNNVYSIKNHRNVINSFWTRLFSSRSAKLVVNHYQVLGLTPKATQSDIKASYYKLSKLYHPDVSQNDQNEEASNKFRQITAAYEILGNLKLRRMYDKGLLPREGITFRNTTTSDDDDDFVKEPANSPYKRTRSQPSTGRTEIYDFDEWSRLHYGNAINRRNVAREKMENRRGTRAEDEKQFQSNDFVSGAIFSILILTMLTAVASSDNDKPITPSSDKKARP